MFLSILAAALKGMFCFTGSYSNNIFPDPLSSEEEEYYIKKYLDDNDKNARNTLIEHNLRLVAHVVKKYEQTRKDTDDLISKIRFYLKHEQDRECIIDKGYEYISQNHTFINRIEEIISICDI